MKNKLQITLLIFALASFAYGVYDFIHNLGTKEDKPTFTVKLPTEREIVVPAPQSEFCLTHLCK